MNAFFQSDEEKMQQQREEKYKIRLHDHVKSGKMNLLEYTYMTDYYTTGTIVNSAWYLDILNKINDSEINNIVVQVFPKIFRKKDNKLIFKLTKLSENIIENKKFHIVFTADQKSAISEIFDFIPDFTKNVYGLYGYAGTGKTTIIVEMLAYLIENKLIKSVAFTAPTNKAVDVIKSKFRSYVSRLHNVFFEKELENGFNFDESLDKLMEIGIKIDFITIHKLLKFELDYGPDGSVTFVRNAGESLIQDYEIVIVDECSMIPLKLIENIFHELRHKSQRSYDNYKKIPKFIFCGDPAQLPPVGENTSIIFLKNEKDFGFDNNDNKYKNLINSIINMNSITLKKVMRSNLDSVTNVCYQIRLWTLGKIKIPVLHKYIGNGVYAYQYNNEKKTTTEWFKKCLSYYKNNNICNIILTWTNKQTFEYNTAIRRKLFGKEKLETFEVGDVLMLNDFYNLDNGQTDLLESNKFNTSEQIKIIKLEIVNKKVNDFPTELNKKALKLQNSKIYASHYKQAVESINKLTKIYKCWKMRVKRISDMETGNDNLALIYVVHESNKKLWASENEIMTSIIKNLRNNLITKFRQKTATIDSNVIKPLWIILHKNMINPFANVNYGYAVTCHKAQGSNFYNVFVDIDDIIKNNKSDEKKKCVYTALTRASNELHILIAD